MRPNTRRSILVDYTAPKTGGLVQQEIIRIPRRRSAREVIGQRLCDRDARIIRVRRWGVDF